MHKSINRRSFLKGALGAGALAALGGPAGVEAAPARAPKAAAKASSEVSAWVWQFNADGSADFIRREAASRNMRVIVKSHDGLRWMSRWDSSAEAVSGPDQLRRLKAYFGRYNVPMDAWCVPTGVDPIAEAEICSQVIDSGVDKLYLDLEIGENGHFWYGSGEDAVRFGKELRRLQPDANIVVAPDSRPWQIDHVPLREFADFSNEIAPQSYWKLFNSPANFRYMSEYGFKPGPDGVTPELMMDITLKTFERFGRKVSPIGDGEAPASDWARFMQEAAQRRVESVSVWRFGLLAPDVWDSIAARNQNEVPDPLTRTRSLISRFMP